jgi:SSS family solute:Na+ symporter
VTFVFSLWTVLSSRGVLPDWLTVPFDLYYTGLIGNVVMFSTIFILAVMISGKKRELKNLTVWTQDGKVIDN